MAELTVVCAACGAEFTIPAGSKEGDVVRCPICEIDLVLVKSGDGFETEIS
jgi:DNA-directed RNA polymerase subunit RPC12/RpoP